MTFNPDTYTNSMLNKHLYQVDVAEEHSDKIDELEERYKEVIENVLQNYFTEQEISILKEEGIA